MSSNIHTTPSCGVDNSSCTHPMWAIHPHNKIQGPIVHPHNLLQKTSEIESKLEASEAMNIIKRNMQLWKIEDIQQPGFSLTNVDPEGKLVGDNDDDFSIQRYTKYDKNVCQRTTATTTAEYFDKSKEEVDIHIDAIKEDMNSFYDCHRPFKDLKFTSPIPSFATAMNELMQDTEEVKLPFPNEVSSSLTAFKELPFPDEVPCDIEIRNYADGSGIDELNPNDYLVLSGIKEKDPIAKTIRKQIEHSVQSEELLTDSVLKDIWVDISEKMPEYTEAKNFASYYKKNIKTEPITFLETWAYNDKDILELSGIDSNDVEEDEMQQDFRVALLRYITNDDMPERCNLGLNEKSLCVNGAPTKISSKAIEMAFCGLSELMGPKRSIEFVGKLVSKKLKKVF